MSCLLDFSHISLKEIIDYFNADPFMCNIVEYNNNILTINIVIHFLLLLFLLLF